MPASLANLRTAVPRSRAEELAAALEQSLENNGLRPGDLVGTLHQIREETGFARSTVSEAVRLLRERGLLEIRPGRGGGLFVAEPNPIIRLRHTLLSAGPSSPSVKDAIQLREELEEFIGLEAAKYRSEDDIKQLRTDLKDMKKSLGDWNSFMQLNWKLHEHIAEICPNEMAKAVYCSTLGYLAQTSSPRIADTPDEAPAYRLHRYQIHENLVNAIAQADENAIRAAVLEHNSPS